MGWQNPVSLGAASLQPGTWQQLVLPNHAMDPKGGEAMRIYHVWILYMDGWMAVAAGRQGGPAVVVPAIQLQQLTCKACQCVCSLSRWLISHLVPGSWEQLAATGSYWQLLTATQID